MRAIPRMTLDDLRTLADQIVRVADPLKVILLGSRARGTERADSDIDLLVVAERPINKPWSRRKTIGNMYRSITSFGVPVDILLFTPDEVSRWQNARNHIVHKALTEGAVLYERHWDSSLPEDQ